LKKTLSHLKNLKRIDWYRATNGQYTATENIEGQKKMRSLFLDTTEWSHRLLSHISSKMDSKNTFIANKRSTADTIPNVDVIVTAAPHIEIDANIIKSMNAKSLFVVEGLNNHKYVAGNIVDKVAVWGDNMKKDFVKKGWPEDKIIVTGCPRFETHKRRVLIALPSYSVSELDGNKVTDDIRMELENHGFIVNIKKHPGISDEKQDIVESLYETEVVITGASTVALHALLMHKKVIYFDTGAKLFDREKHFEPLVKTGIKICYNVKDILNELKHDEYILHYLHDADDACKNVIKLIKEMAQSG